MEKDWISDILDIQLGCHFCFVNCPFDCRVQIDLLLTTMTAKLPILALPKKQFDLYFFWILSKTLCWSLAFQFQEVECIHFHFRISIRFLQDSFTRCFKSNPPEPWNWNIYLFPLWCLGVVVRYGVLFPIRFSLFNFFYFSHLCPNHELIYSPIAIAFHYPIESSLFSSFVSNSIAESLSWQ